MCFEMANTKFIYDREIVVSLLDKYIENDKDMEY